tara:strand:+ start:516 stop:1274 length:759 start_codon:yes stop_codon:yes gene_type:complete
METNEVHLPSLKALNKEIIELLDRNRLFNVLVKKEFLSKILNEVIIEKKLLDSIKDSLLKRENLKDETQFEEWLIKTGSSIQNFEKQTITKLQLNKYCLDNFSRKTESYFLSKQDELDYATYSLIRVNDFCLANELFMRINEGENSFEEIASEYSTGPEKITKGLIGPLPVAQGHPTIRNLIRMSEIGIPTNPIKVGNSYIIFQLESLRKSTLDDSMKLDLSKQLFDKWLDEKVDLLVDSLKLKYKAPTPKT